MEAINSLVRDNSNEIILVSAYIGGGNSLFNSDAAIGMSSSALLMSAVEQWPRQSASKLRDRLFGDGKLLLCSSLSNEIWQFHPDSRPIFSLKTRERNSFSLLKCTNRMHARSKRSTNWTTSICAWYCIVTMPMNTWWHCISKHPSASQMSSALLLSENSSESELMECCRPAVVFTVRPLLWPASNVQ